MTSDVIAYIEKQKNPQKEICRKLREIIFNIFPDIKEETKWGVPAFDGGIFYIVALKNDVNLGFSINGLKKDELSLFDGGGKTTKHIKIKSLEDLNQNRITDLLKLIYQNKI